MHPHLPFNPHLLREKDGVAVLCVRSLVRSFFIPPLHSFIDALSTKAETDTSAGACGDQPSAINVSGTISTPPPPIPHESIDEALYSPRLFAKTQISNRGSEVA